MKKLYSGEFEFECSYTKGYWFWKKEMRQTVKFPTDAIFLSETEVNAKVKFIENSDYWKIGYVPYGYLSGGDVWTYDVLTKKVFVKELKKHNFNQLKKNMNTDEFLEYCKQEVVDPITT